MRAALRLAVVAVPMGVLLSRTMAWMSSGKTHPELISRLRGNGPKSGRVVLLYCIESELNDVTSLVQAYRGHSEKCFT